MRKILYSPGFGAGWSSWQSVPTRFACEYLPIIDALESGDELNEDHLVIQQYVKDCKERYNEDIYLGGLSDLIIFEINDDDQYIIKEYDGSESVQTRESTNWN